MSFQNLQLADPVLRAIDACGYATPTPVQARSIPEVLAGRDLIASAQTGTGKTAAFMLPVLHKLARFKKGPKGAPRVLVLTPTRELAAQVTEATRTYGRFLHVRSTVILGGSPYGPQFRDLGRPIDLVVGTPGRLIDHLERGSLDLSRLEILILDEVLGVGDASFRVKSAKRIEEMAASGVTLLVVTHDSGIQTVCQRSIWLDQGRIRGDGPSEEIQRKYHEEAVPAEVQPQIAEPVSR